MYERFTDRARHAVTLADLACRELGHPEVGTEHILLGVMQDAGTAHHVLRAMGATADGARSTIVERFGKGDGTPEGQLTYSVDANAALAVALRESLGLRHEQVGTEHLLLGLLRQSSSRAVEVLSCLRVNPDSVRERIFDLIATPGFRSPETGPIPVTRLVEDSPAAPDLGAQVAQLRDELVALRAVVEHLQATINGQIDADTAAGQ